MLLVVCQFGHFVTDGPVERFDLSAGLQVDDAVAEQVEGLFADVLGVVPVLEQRAARQFVPNLRQVVHEFVVLGAGLEVFGHLGCRDALQHVDDEHAVVGCQRAAALGDDVGVGDVVAVGSLHECPHAVVDVLLDAVVDGRLGVRRARAVVVDAQSAAAVHEFDAEAHLVQLHVVLCGFAQGGGNASDFRNLAADVEVEQLQTVAQPHLVEQLQGHEQLGAVEAELRGVAAALAPLAAAVRGQFDADAQVGLHAQPAGRLGNNLQLGQFLDDQEHALAHLLGQQCQLDEVLVLVAVADDEAVAVHVGGQHGVQLGFRAGLQSQVVALAVADDFLHDGAHLVNLDREDDEVFGLVVVFLGSLAETLVGLLDAVVQDVGEAQQHGCRHVACSQFVDHLFEVDLHAVLLGRNIHVSLLVNAKVVDSPTLDVVEFLGVFDAPLLHI